MLCAPRWKMRDTKYINPAKIMLPDGEQGYQGTRPSCNLRVALEGERLAYIILVRRGLL